MNCSIQVNRWHAHYIKRIRRIILTRDISAMKSQINKIPPEIITIAAAVIISFSSVWVNIADVEPTSSAFYRVFIGSIFLLPFCLKNTLTAIDREILSRGLLCALYFALDLMCWHEAIVRIGPGLSTLLGNFEVFILAAIGIFILKEKHKKTLFIAVPLALVGIFLLAEANIPTLNSSYGIGILLGFTTAFLYALFILELKKLTQICSNPFLPITLVSLISAAILAIFMVLQDITFSIPDTKSCLSLFALGLFSQCIGWYLISNALPKVRTSIIGLILLVQPTLSFIWDVLIFHRSTTGLNWFGLCITLSAIYVGIMSKQSS